MLFHVTRPSLLSSEASKSTSRGLMNVGMLVVALINFRQFLRLCANVQMWCYRDGVATLLSLFREPWRWPMLLLCTALHFFIVSAYLVEKLAIHGINIPLPGHTAGPDVIRCSRSTHERAVRRLHTLLMALQLILPGCVVLLAAPQPVWAAPVVILYLIWFLKNMSYITLNYQHRRSYIDAHVRYILAFEENEPGPSSKTDPPQSSSPDLCRRKANMISTGVLPRYPNNVTLRDVYYFAFCPSLCYDLNFPRTRRIRIKWLLRRTLEFFLSFTIFYLLIEQRMLPHACKYPVRFPPQGVLSDLLECVCQVLVFNLLVWLMGFYLFFHLFLNILAEILQFGDRMFYLDFWNATTIDHFWRSWNVPGYRWMLRHIYGPLLKSGYTRTQASAVVFLVSALIHEYTLGIIFQQRRCLAFLLVAFQVPLAIMTQRFVKGTQMGNLIFWMNMVFGPHCFSTLIYALDYLYAHAYCDTRPS